MTTRRTMFQPIRTNHSRKTAGHLGRCLASIVRVNATRGVFAVTTRLHLCLNHVGTCTFPTSNHLIHSLCAKCMTTCVNSVGTSCIVCGQVSSPDALFLIIARREYGQHS